MDKYYFLFHFLKELLEEARQYTEKKTTHLHLPFSKTCLNAVTFLATGESMSDLNVPVQGV